MTKQGSSLKRNRKPVMNEEEKARAWLFKLRMLGEPCAGCGITPQVVRYYHQSHHVVYQQHVEGKGGDPWATTNALPLCGTCHELQHKQTRKVLLSALRDENYTFAYDLLGPAAYDYLKRRYSGEDPRLDALLPRSKAA